MITADTNIFIYAVQSGDGAKRRTAALAVERLAALRSPLALQVVGEFQNSARRALGVTGQERAQYGRDLLTVFDTFGATPTAVLRAIEAFAEGRLSYWDAVLVASAGQFGCHTLLSEDMGGIQLGVRIVNPFDSSGDLSSRAREVLDL